jgi:CheY-like chemotaxis protein
VGSPTTPQEVEMSASDPTLSRTVFIVDDDRDIREDLGQLLRDEGFAVEAAWNGAEAMKRLQGGLRPDVIILDLMMPVMDGVTFRGELKKQTELSSIPVIGLTAWPGTRVDFECLAKPVGFDKLMGRIRTAMH